MRRVVEGTPNRGCPQGEVLSPLLWCLAVNDLLEDLQREGFHGWWTLSFNPKGCDGVRPEDNIQMV
jgi:hypothetical protein